MRVDLYPLQVLLVTLSGQRVDPGAAGRYDADVELVDLAERHDTTLAAQG